MRLWYFFLHLDLSLWKNPQAPLAQINHRGLIAFSPCQPIALFALPRLERGELSRKWQRWPSQKKWRRVTEKGFKGRLAKRGVNLPSNGEKVIDRGLCENCSIMAYRLKCFNGLLCLSEWNWKSSTTTVSALFSCTRSTNVARLRL